jgi:hypothetical protein
MLHQEADKPAHEARITDCIAQRSGIGASQRQETGKQFRLARKPGKNSDCRFVSALHGLESLLIRRPELPLFQPNSASLAIEEKGRFANCETYISQGDLQGGDRQQGIDMPKQVMIVEDNELNMKLFHDLLEVHPEVAFVLLVGDVLPRKRSWSGVTTRRAVLERAGLELPDRFPGDDRAAPDDVLDAAVCALVADAAAAGAPLVTVPEVTDQRDHGRPIVISARPPAPVTPGPRRSG